MTHTHSCPLPEEDRAEAPITGWTREHWTAVADWQLAAVWRHGSPGCARIEIPGRTSSAGRDSDGQEGFSRSFMLAAFRAQGGGEGATAYLDRYATGLVSGTAPGGPEQWPLPRALGQAIVESAGLVVALHYSREHLWDRLDEQARAQACAYLRHVSFLETPDNNWRLFTVIVDEFLLAHDHDMSASDRRRRADEIERQLAHLESWYAGGGWYTDGGAQRFDHYGGWALHLYPQVWAQMAQHRVPELAAQRQTEFDRRLDRFLHAFAPSFGDDGSPIQQGRSLTYRHAALAAIWLGVVRGVGPLAPGQARTLCSRSLRYFVDNGGLGDDGISPLGWFDEFLPMTQVYSGPSSPLWSAKGCLGLALPADHEVWRSPEERLPWEGASATRWRPAPGFLVGRGRDGVVRLVNHGSDSYPHHRDFVDPFYSRLTYSTVTSPMPESRLDQCISLIGEDGPSVRTQILRLPGRATSRHHPVWKRGDTPERSSWRIDTASAIADDVELRLHAVWQTTPQEGADAQPVEQVSDGGACVAGDEPCELGDGRRHGMPCAWAMGSRAGAWILGVAGWENAVAETADGSTAMGRHGALVRLVGSPPEGRHAWYLTATGVVPGGVDPRWPLEEALAQLQRSPVVVEEVRRSGRISATTPWGIVALDVPVL